jgi:hypothetical protein
MALTRASLVLMVQPTVIMVLVVMVFACSDTADAFAIKWVAKIHQDITKEALELSIELPNGEVKEFSRGVVLEIENHNIRVDDDQGKEYTDRHFDNENFPGGSQRLVQLRDYIVSLLVHESFIQLDVPVAVIEADRRIRKAREQMGEALHTLQDFYAHSNWVERTGLSTSQINSKLGVKVLEPAYPADACDTNDLANSALTSAFSDGLLGLCTAPDNKCAHGYGGTIPCQGINKDSWEQAEDDVFFAARSQAVFATRNFVRDTLLEVFSKRYIISAQLGEAGALQATQLAVCQFMGVPNPLSTCVASHTVTVQKLNNADGSATYEGLVESSGNTITPAIDCGLLCEGTAIAGTQVQLIASDTGNWRFASWGSGGVCAGSTSPECSFVVDSNKTAKAEFFEDDFAFEVAESEAPWSSLNPRLNCFHYEGEYLVTGYTASFDRCYSGMSAVIRCVGSSCDSSRFKVAISKSILSFTDGTCNSYQDPYGADPGSAQTYVPGSNWWFGLGEGWTKAWPSVSAISPLANGNSIFQNFHWIGDDPGAACVGDQTRTLELEFNVYDLTTGKYTSIPFVINVP